MLKIMFVDDEVNVLDGLRRMLRKMKNEWDMTFLQSGSEALEELGKNKYDVIVCDYKMPEMNGLDVLKQVGDKYSDIKRILLTGQSQTEIFDYATKIAHYYIAKPCNHEELIKIITS